MSVDYRCKCEKRKYVDPSERNGYKWYCEFFRWYVDPDEAHECKHFKKA